ncbi:hypothetical protein AmaxDRAFT_3505 [Limnospira maxima CS-328]|uniref:Uncharacterized protein n=1 Tax=Limnospira maxima CS-328 TaxID=513049 RepID=B5W407_LIMMA|nr:hypothetical protein AmaxDRAFT_3505 [Limnospira maxima CS-328]
MSTDTLNPDQSGDRTVVYKAFRPQLNDHQGGLMVKHAGYARFLMRLSPPACGPAGGEVDRVRRCFCSIIPLAPGWHGRVTL